MSQYVMRRELPSSVRRYISEAAEQYGITPAMVRERKRTRQAVSARAQVARRLRRDGCSLELIGSYLGLHHTSILYLLDGLPPRVPQEIVIPCPDFSGEWAI